MSYTPVYSTVILKKIASDTSSYIVYGTGGQLKDHKNSLKMVNYNFLLATHDMS